MSCWTHIHAGIIVDFGNATKWDIYEFFRNMKDEKYTLCYDPKMKGNGYEITGSEQNATVVFAKVGDYVLNPQCRFFGGNVWSIHITGSLRDRELHETVAEWNRFAWKLGWFIRRIRRLSQRPDWNDDWSRASVCQYFVEISDYDEVYRRSSCKILKDYKKGGSK